MAEHDRDRIGGTGMTARYVGVLVAQLISLALLWWLQSCYTAG